MIVAGLKNDFRQRRKDGDTRRARHICFGLICHYALFWKITKNLDIHEQAYARIGMAKEAADAASQAKDNELLGRLKLTFSQNAAASSIFDTLRDRLSFQGVS